MARTALRWSLDDLAASAKIGRASVARYEAGETLRPETVGAMRRAFEEKGVQFLDNGKLAGGVVPPRGE